MATLAGCAGDGDDSDDPGVNDADSDFDTGDDPGTDPGGGDDEPGSEGLVYAFAPGQIALVDPAGGEVVDHVADDLGERDWGDARLTRDASKIFAVDGSLGQVAVVDTGVRDLVEWVDVGSGPVHAYQPVEDEIWVHADGEGTFYVIDIESLEVIETVESGLENEGHGKLIYHDDIYPAAYATNTNDPAGLVVDLETYERTETIEFGEGPGTHYAAYAPRTGLVYYEWFGGETPVVDPETNEVVDRLDVTGGLEISPDGSLLGMWDDDELHFFDATTGDSDHLGTVDLDGRGPDDIKYHEADDTWYAFVANTTSEDVTVVDIDALEVVEHIPAGAIDRDGEHLHRSGDGGDGYYVTTAGADGTVAVIDTAQLELLYEVEVAEGVDTIRYVSKNADGS